MYKLMVSKFVCNIAIIVDIRTIHQNFIDFLISSPSDPIKWRGTRVYRFSDSARKFLTRELITDLDKVAHNLKWPIFGDFNIVQYQGEKAGVTPQICPWRVALRMSSKGATLLIWALKEISLRGPIISLTRAPLKSSVG